jgi:hypothetical protein
MLWKIMLFASSLPRVPLDSSETLWFAGFMELFPSRSVFVGLINFQNRLWPARNAISKDAPASFIIALSRSAIEGP